MPGDRNNFHDAELPARSPERSRSRHDAELVHAARRGDKRAFVEIVARHQAMVCGVALGILGDFAASEDAGQDAFLMAWRKLHELREPESLRAWLAQIARNAALGHRRRQRDQAGLDQAADFADPSPTPDAAAATADEAALVRDALAKLPETYRLPLVLFYREGQSVRAVAESLAISEDAVKQRLARGREMLREQISGLIETVLTRTAPTTVFTMTIAAAIGALAAPAAVASSVFAASAAGAASSAGATSTSFFTAMSSSKTFLVGTALVALVCVPVGYQLGAPKSPPREARITNEIEATLTPTASPAGPTFENSALFAEWRRLHDIHGTTPEAMPALYQAIAGIKDSFRRRAFRAALIAEWVQLDPAGGLAFFRDKSRVTDASQRRLFFEEWLARDARVAVDALLASGSGWESIARGSLKEIARRVPARVATIADRLPKSDSFWDTSVRDAFAVVAQGGLTSARQEAEAITGPMREQALSGVAQAWAKSDLSGAIAWAKSLPEGTDRDEIVRAAVTGAAVTDPAQALDQVGLVPPGGRDGFFATTTGARVLKEAVNADYDKTIAWVAANPGRLGREDLVGLADAMARRLNADPVGFLNRHAADGSLSVLLRPIESALMNDAEGQKAVVWEWLKTQPQNETTETLRQHVMSSAGYQDPALALRLAAELPTGPKGDEEVRELANRLFNGGRMLHRFDQLMAEAPDRLRAHLPEEAFRLLRSDELADPRQWIERLQLLPESARGRGIENLARAWAERSHETALEWVRTLAPGEPRAGAVAAVAEAWANADAPEAAQWIGSMSPGVERDRSAGALVSAIAESYPREAWEWASSIVDPSERSRAASRAVAAMAARDAATARQWMESDLFTPEVRKQIAATLKPSEPKPSTP